MATKKEKMISINELEKAAKEARDLPEKEVVEWGGVSFEIKTTLSIHEVVAFVTGVVDECYINDMKTYVPEVKDFLKGCYVLGLYAGCRLPDDISKKYDLVVRLRGLIDLILERVDRKQYAAIETAIEERLHNNNATISAAALSQVSAITASVENLEGQLADVFKGVTPEQMTTFIDAFATGAIDEEKLARAIVEKKYGEGAEHENQLE